MRRRRRPPPEYLDAEAAFKVKRISIPNCSVASGRARNRGGAAICWLRLSPAEPHFAVRLRCVKRFPQRLGRQNTP